jgi:5-methylcytosine-specific restriction endonuclease McrA
MPCWPCGRPVVHNPAQRNGGWTVGHIIDRAQGGSDHISNQRPEHSHCNYRAGGQAGAAITNARRPAVLERLASNRERGIRGI